MALGMALGLIIGVGIGVPLGFMISQGRQGPTDVIVEQRVQERLRAQEQGCGCSQATPSSRPPAAPPVSRTNITSLTYNDKGELITILEKQ